MINDSCFRQEIAPSIEKSSSAESPRPIESPMTELAFRFCFSTLNTPTSTMIDECPANQDNNKQNEDTDAADKTTSKIDEENKKDVSQVDEEEGIISSELIINSAGISPATRQQQQQARGARARKNVNPQIVNFDLKCDSPGKENVGEEDISFYSALSPSASPRQCSAASPSLRYAISTQNAMNFNSQDSSSMDSGYSRLHRNSNNRISTASTSAFNFIKPSPPSDGYISSPSSNRTPSKYSMTANGSSRMGNGFKVFNSLTDSESRDSCDPDDCFMELMEMENMDEDAQMPTDLKSLICKDIKSSTRTPENKRSSFARKCLYSLEKNGAKSLLFNSPQAGKNSTITSLITTPERKCLSVLNDNISAFNHGGHRNLTTGAFKRPEPPSGLQSPVQIKRLKCDETITSTTVHLPNFPLTNSVAVQPIKRQQFRKSVSMNDAAIMSALSRSTSEPNLIGDCSLPFCLPLIEGRHTDLKSITADTMRKLLNGEFDESIASYKIIDCRYPYEYEGGHIRGAINLYTQEQIIEELVKIKTDTPTITAGDQKRHILVFHCEFSSERGPKLSRFLRNHDRTKNGNSYPALHYPEIYLLHNGYKEFFESNSDLCLPNTYRPMNDPNFSEECKQFRAKSKSFGDGRGHGTNRLPKSRSRLVL